MFDNMRRVLCATHDGIFHADDVVSFALLTLLHRFLPGFPTPQLTRTRDPKVLGEQHIVFDVGGEYEVVRAHNVYRLDHHQRGGAGLRPNGVPYAAAGLMWKTFGLELCGAMAAEHALSVLHDNAVFEKFDQQFIQPIDANDCGFEMARDWEVPTLRPLTLSSIISGFNPRWDEDMSAAESLRRFGAAAQVARTSIEHALGGMLAAKKAADIVRDSDRVFADKVLALGRFCPWTEAVLENVTMTDILYVVYKQPGEGQPTWMVQCVPCSLGSFSKRKALPEPWAGLRSKEETKGDGPTIEAVSGVADAVFCHPGRFICGAKSKAGALKLAEIAVMT